MASPKQKGLGRGLGALLSAATPETKLEEQESGDRSVETIESTEQKDSNQRLGLDIGAERLPGDVILELPVDDVYPNMEQPRKRFLKEELESLAESIRETGVIIPIIVTKTESGYQIVAGERRWRASKLADKSTIPAIVRELNELQVLQQALIENIQRQDLNPLEEAESLKRLIDEYSMKQEEVSKLVGRSRPAIANILRLLNLSPKVKQMLLDEDLSAGHARALLPIIDDEKQFEAANQIKRRSMSVRDTEKMVKQLLKEPTPAPVQTIPDRAVELSIKSVEDRCAKALGTKVRLKDRNNKGTIMIEYFSNEDLDRIIEIFEARG